MSVNFETEDVVSTGDNIDSSITKHVSEQVLLSTGIRVGTLVKTKSMSSFISRTRPDGLHIIDVAKTLQRIELASKFISISLYEISFKFSVRKFSFFVFLNNSKIS